MNENDLFKRAYLFSLVLHSKTHPFYLSLTHSQRLMLTQTFIRTKRAHEDKPLEQQVAAFRSNLTDLLGLTEQAGDPFVVDDEADEIFDVTRAWMRMGNIVAPDAVPSFSFFPAGRDNMPLKVKNNIVFICGGAYREATKNKLPPTYNDPFADGPV